MPCSTLPAAGPVQGGARAAPCRTQLGPAGSRPHRAQWSPRCPRCRRATDVSWGRAGQEEGRRGSRPRDSPAAGQARGGAGQGAAGRSRGALAQPQAWRGQEGRHEAEPGKSEGLGFVSQFLSWFLSIQPWFRWQ